MGDLIHLIYTSVATQEFEATALSELLRKSRRNNEGAGLTGMLLFADGTFFQVLEGTAEDVDGLCKKIEQDKRHRNVTIIIREPIARRYFGDWSMGFSAVSHEELRDIDGLNDFFQKNSCFSDLGIGRAKRLLAAFAQGRWRGRLGQATGQTSGPQPVRAGMRMLSELNHGG